MFQILSQDYYELNYGRFYKVFLTNVFYKWWNLPTDNNLLSFLEKNNQINGSIHFEHFY